MFYVSSKRGDKLGVTDTKDGVEEFYTREELASFYRNDGIKIVGFDYTGSGFRIEVKSLELIMLDKLAIGDAFYFNGSMSIKLAETSKKDFVVFSDISINKVTRKDLALKKYSVEYLKPDDDVDLYKKYGMKYFKDICPEGLDSYWVKEVFNV